MLVKNQTLFFILELIVFTIGLLSNFLALITFAKSKKLINIGSKNTYLYLFIVDSLFLIIMVLDRAFYFFGYDLITYSSITCKLYPYFNRILATLSPMLLVFISIERYVSLQDLSKKFILRDPKNQFIYLMIIIIYNSLYFSPCLIYFEVLNINYNYSGSNITWIDFDSELRCQIVDTKLKVIMPIMDLINRVIVPCLLMTSASILLVITVHKSRAAIFQNVHGSVMREAKFALSSIGLNVLYVTLTLPLPAVLLLGNYVSDIILFFNFYLFCVSYSINFYILFVLNTLFRKEFYALFIKENERVFETFI